MLSQVRPLTPILLFLRLDPYVFFSLYIVSLTARPCLRLIHEIELFSPTLSDSQRDCLSQPVAGVSLICFFLDVGLFSDLDLAAQSPPLSGVPSLMVTLSISNLVPNDYVTPDQIRFLSEALICRTNFGP